MRLPDPERQGARPGLLVVLVALAIVITTVWYREGDTGALHRLRRGVQAVAAPVSAVGETVTRPVRAFVSWAKDIGVTRSRLEEMRVQNARLRARVAELEEVRLENARLRELLAVTRAGELEVKVARVIGRPPSAWEGVITIDLGRRDGIATGMPVLGPFGLLGQIIETTTSSSRVQLITDPRSGVAAMVQSTRAEGIVRGSIDGRLTLDFVSVETTVSPGDVVITSGMGGRFPKGIVVGEVIQVERPPGALQQRILLLPNSDPSNLEEVLVVVEGLPVAEIGGGE